MEEIDLEGVSKVTRTGGLLPPLVGVCKRIEGARGWTVVGAVRLPFDVVGAELRYRGPLRGLVDKLVPEGPDACAGTAKLLGRPFGSFRMTRVGR